MSRWLEQRGAWQYFFIMWAIVVSAALAGALSFAMVSGYMRTGVFAFTPFGLLVVAFMPFGSLITAAGATLGRQIRKRGA
ncbi:MAG TPA: hypothetical protein VGI96_37175 [Streptosporangiaceae bacterium]|jgi:hypothetical protein